MHSSDELKLPQGFSFAGVSAGIKARKRDLGLILSESRCTAAGTFTKNELRAGSVRWCQRLLPATGIRALVVSSGNANALTGPRADEDTRTIAAAISSRLDIPLEATLVATTGVVGVRFPVDRVTRAAESLVAALGEDVVPLAEAMLTTDTERKIASREIFLGGTRVRVLGVAKGSGMVHPNMATVLGFLLTDAVVAPPALSEITQRVTGSTWNALSVDRSTSTNDMALLLANGVAENVPIVDSSSDGYRAFEEAVWAVSDDLARQVARDGEGARHFLEVCVRGGPTVEHCQGLARAIVGNDLVKAAIFGTDPSVGRVLAALGAEASERGVRLEESSLSVSIQGVVCFDRGSATSFDRDVLRTQLRQRDVRIEIQLGIGGAEARAYGCDLTYDYVRINADYAAVLAEPDGPVRRDTRLDTKTPELKTEILIAALRYIERFAKTRAVIRYGRATLESSQRAVGFAEDVRLLMSAGLLPILVQEGSSELVVTALARAGVRAVGLSGADGGLLAWPGKIDAGQSGVVVDPDVVETLLAKGYVPVIVPEFTEEASRLVGTGASLDVDRVAAEVAVACRAKKLIFLGETAGLVRDGALLSEVSLDDLGVRIDEGRIEPALVSRCEAARTALTRGLDSAHLLDERIPHVVVAELFTDSGVGTMVR